MRAGRLGGISLLVAGMMAQGFPALAEQGGTTAPAGSAGAPPSASAAPAPAGSAGAAPPAAAPEHNPPDLVELKDGGMYRGTISELVPDDHVVIVTVTGASKTFDMKDVKYAGPASQAPGAAPAAPPAKPEGEEKHEKEERTKPIITVHADEARLLIKGDKPGLTLYRKSATAVAVGSGGAAVASGYDVICTAPCDASLPAGTQTLAVSYKRGSPVEADPVALPAGESRLTAHYEKKTGLRVAGWLVLAGGVAVGTTLMVVAVTKTKQDCSLKYITGECTTETATDGGMLVMGGLLMAAGIGLGLAMGLQHDKVSVSVRPVDAALLRHPSWSNPALDRASYRSVGAPGLGLTARF